MQKIPIDQLAKRTQRYWYEDGIWEIGFALLNLLLAGFFWLVASIDWSGPLVVILLLLQVGVIIAAGFVVNRVTIFLKERITYPRTGYVAYRKPARSSRLKRFVLTAALAAVMGGIIGFVASGSAAQNRVPIVTGILLGGVLTYLGYRFGLVRMYPLAVLVVALGFLIAQTGMAANESSMAFFAGFGVLLLLSGGITLLIYLRRTRPAVEDEYTPFGPQ